MNREPNNRNIKNIPDLFDEALELEETIVQPSPKEADLPGEMTAETADIAADPTFLMSRSSMFRSLTLRI